jgi:hypothetical protein
MGRRILCFIYLIVGVGGLLATQTLEERIIYVPPVSGAGANDSDGEWFTEMARMEIPARGFILGETEEGAQYTLVGSLSPSPSGDPSARLFALHLALILNETGDPMVEQELVYSSQEGASEWFSVIIFTMLSNIPPAGIIMPDQPVAAEIAAAPPDRAWQNKWFYLGACLEWDHRRYIHGDESSFKDGLGGRVFVELQFLNFMSVEAGVEAARDEPRYDGEAFKVYVLEGYATLKGVLKPMPYFMFEPYAGVSVNVPFSAEIDIPSLSWVAGMQFGVKVGPGCLFTDFSYSQDFAQSSIKIIDLPFDRQIINVALGYKIGFFDRKRRE